MKKYISYTYTTLAAIIMLFTAFGSRANAQTIICQGDSVCFDAGTFRGNIQWQESPTGTGFNDINGATFSPFCDVPPLGMHFIRGVITEGSCDTIFTDTMQVNIVPSPVADAGVDMIGCGGMFTGNIGGTTTGGTPSYTWSWSPAGGLSSPTIEMPVATVTVNTTYTVTAMDTNGCTSSDAMTVWISPPIVVNAGADTTMLPCTIVIGGSPTASGGIAPLTYAWSPSATLDDATLANPTADPPAMAVTTYTVLVTDSLGCTATDDIEITTLHTMSFNATGAVDTFVVPACVDTIFLQAWGGQGGTGNGGNAGPGGLGGYAEGFLLVAPGDLIFVNVAGQGGTVTPGYPNGGNGGNAGANGQGGGGGGSSAISHNALVSVVAVAGGGGGGGGTGCEIAVTGLGGAGGSGGGGNGANGQDEPTPGGVAGGGFGATGPAGGGAGIGCGGFLGSAGANGTPGFGGAGGGGQTCCCFGTHTDPSGGGGGGGVMGGGGGGGGSAGTTGCSGNDKGAGGGGAGGTSSTAGLINGVTNNGIWLGNGMITITW